MKQHNILDAYISLKMLNKSEYYGYVKQSEWKVIEQLLFVTCDKFIKSTIRYNDL